ncbi:Unknown protein, partial [Striga hermonthica]
MEFPEPTCSRRSTMLGRGPGQGPPLGFSGPSQTPVTPTPILQGVGASTAILGERLAPVVPRRLAQQLRRRCHCRRPKTSGGATRKSDGTRRSGGTWKSATASQPKKENSPQRGRSPRRSSPKRSGPKRTSPRREGRVLKWERRDDRWQGRPLSFQRRRYHNFTPLRKDLTEVLEVMEQKMLSEDVTWLKTRFTSLIRPRSDSYCRFHRDYFHTTENCRYLKDEIERLIRAEHLKEFMYHDRAKGKGRRRCREDSEERSDRDEEGDDRNGRDGRGKKPRRDGDKRGHEGEAPMKRGTIYMISGGPTDGDSNNARKEHARAVKRKREEVGITACMSVICFKVEDADGVVLPHNDALAITTEVAGFDVKRVFIDIGSSMDVMFYDCFVQINKELNMELKPMATALYRFNGGKVMPMGEISLPVALGSGVTGKVWMVRFVVVGAESSYNIIMERTSLNAFQAVVSTYHMTIKYPVGENIGEIAGDQLTSRSCYQMT